MKDLFNESPNHITTKLFQNTRVGWLTPYVCQQIRENYADAESDGCLLPMQEDMDTKKEIFGKLKIGDVSEKINNELRKILWDYRNVFSENKRDLGCADIQHEIITRDHPPIALKSRRIPVALEEEVDQQVQKMLADGIIRESTSP